jgi:hypothetical protein
MPDRDDVAWFKGNFAGDMTAAIAATPFSIDMLTAVACQETGEVWARLRRKGRTVARILELCVGDTIDKRSVFPRSRSELVGAPDGQKMFDIARAALVDMASEVPGYAAAVRNPDKFCHGYGIFQYDIQFFKGHAEYFLERRYIRFDQALGKCVDELGNALKALGWQGRASLTDLETAAVAIVYNMGRKNYRPEKGLKQGYFDGKKYYGENFFDFLRLAHSVATGGGAPALFGPPAKNEAIVAPPSPVAAGGETFEVDTLVDHLRVRSTPDIDKSNPRKNVIGQLPDGQLVKALTGKTVNGFLEIQTSLNGALIQGFASQSYLKRAAGAEVPQPVAPSPSPPTGGIVAVYCPRPANSVTKRTEPANALSLNEPGQPQRKGSSPDELRASLAAVIDWLGVDDASHKRYQPHGGLTFCNIYAHDYCYLSGVYLPRVFWTAAALEKLARGEAVEPNYGKTIEEVRANDLFRWLRDFGERFGWRRSSTLTKLQTEVNQGAIGLIVARRREDGRSGHIVAIVPETASQAAKRNSAGEVIAPLQSQAGSRNFRYGTGTANWWNAQQFAESAFWLHA